MGQKHRSWSRRRAKIALLEARIFVEQNFAEELSLRKVAKAVSMQPNYLCERFKQ